MYFLWLQEEKSCAFDLLQVLFPFSNKCNKRSRKEGGKYSAGIAGVRMANTGLQKQGGFSMRHQGFY